jgi:uncharacterized protein YicC (UPF0701 family)
MKDLLQKKANIEKTVEKIKELSEKETVSYLERLKTRLKNVLGELDIELDSARILTECAVRLILSKQTETELTLREVYQV